MEDLWVAVIGLPVGDRVPTSCLSGREGAQLLVLQPWLQHA